MNLYSVYRTPGKAPPKWVMEAGAVLVCLVGLPILVVWYYFLGGKHGRRG